MQYALSVRAFLSVVHKDKAIALSLRLFPGLPVECVGRYWKDDSLWEFTAQQQWEFPDDQKALWETLSYFYQLHSQWQLQFAPDEHNETLVSGTAENNFNTGWSWCHFELGRIDAAA